MSRGIRDRKYWWDNQITFVKTTFLFFFFQFRSPNLTFVDNPSRYILMMDCWQVAPQRRPTFVELSQHLSKMFSDEKVGLIPKISSCQCWCYVIIKYLDQSKICPKLWSLNRAVRVITCVWCCEKTKKALNSHWTSGQHLSSVLRLVNQRKDLYTVRSLSLFLLLFGFVLKLLPLIRPFAFCIVTHNSFPKPNLRLLSLSFPRNT